MRAGRLLLVVVCATVACGCTAAPSPSTTAGATTMSASPTGAAPSVTPVPSPTASSAVDSYLALAHEALPHLSQSELTVQARTICSTIRTGSRHDAVGELAGQVGSQAEADRLVTAAVSAYCPELSGKR